MANTDSKLYYLQQVFSRAVTSSESTEIASMAHLDVYQSNYQSQLVNVLANHYDVCQRLVGEDFFAALAREYMRAFPSKQYDINAYGADFPQFLKNFTHTQSMPYLSEVARLEWAYQRCFVAAAAVDDLAAFEQLLDLSAQEQSSLRWRCHPTIELLHLNCPASEIWRVNQPDYKGTQLVDLSKGEEYLLLWRPHWQVAIECISKAEWLLFHKIYHGLQLKDVASYSANCDDGFDVSALLPQWVARGWIIGFTQ